MKVIRLCALVIIIALAYAFYASVRDAGAKGEQSLGYIHNIVSLSDCSARIHWQYHNDDRGACGQAADITYDHQDMQANNEEPTFATDNPGIVIDDGGASVPDDTDTTPSVQDDKPADNNESGKGNPGNDKAVGNAGEKCDKGMCENADHQTGEKGKSNND